MDRKITRQEACSYFGTVAVGYCEAQSLLNGLYRFGYNSGVYGWKFEQLEALRWEFVEELRRLRYIK